MSNMRENTGASDLASRIVQMSTPITSISDPTVVNSSNVTMDPIEVVRIMDEKHPEMMHEFRKIQSEQLVLFAQKQMSYGKSNIMLGGDIDIAEDRMGAIRGITIRLNDKLQRLINLVLRGVVNPLNDENVSDTFIDISIYAMISLIVERGKWK